MKTAVSKQIKKQPLKEAVLDIASIQKTKFNLTFQVAIIIGRLLF